MSIEHGKGERGVYKRIIIVCGHYGSGKTEFSVNLALKLAKDGFKTALVDMDVVNVAFRSRELKKFLIQAGVDVISTTFNSDATDLPAISAKVKSPLEDKSYHGIYDLGGNPAGTRSFVQFANLVDTNDYDLLFVLNANRPETRSCEKALTFYREIESTLGLKITKIVNNTHLISESTVKDIEKGNKVSLELSEIVGTPLKYVAGTREILDQAYIPLGAERFEMDLLMRKRWMNIR
jgi:hypothetical protein